MIILGEKEMSFWAFNECRKGNNTKEIRNLIINSMDAYEYCRDIKDIKEMWSKIKTSMWAEMYCKFVKDRPEVRKWI